MRFIKLVLLVGLFFFALGGQEGHAQSVQEERMSLHNQETTRNVQIYPNPATEFLHIKLEQVPADKVVLTLHNIIGNEMEIETEVISEYELRVRVKDLASGYYLLAIRDEGSNFRGTYKILKR